MGLTSLPLIWAQAGGVPANPVALATLALRRWCGSLTLSSPLPRPSLDGLWALLAGLGVLLLVAAVLQGPGRLLHQLIDIPGHARLVHRGTRRVWRATRLVAVAIGFTVLAWTGSQAITFLVDVAGRGKADLLLLTRSRGLAELALEQGTLAGLTPVRDLAGLGDNLPLAALAVFLVFRASTSISAVSTSAVARAAGGTAREKGKFTPRPRMGPGLATLVWGCGSLYILYRLVARAAGSPDLPLGPCLVVEALLIPSLMLVTDGFLLAWFLAELRNAQFDRVGEQGTDPAQALELMPGAMAACFVALPARYLATMVFLAQQHLPTWAAATPVGGYVRWQLGWGLIDLQAASFVGLGLIGTVAWGRGSVGEAFRGLLRLLTGQGGHLVVALTLSATAAGLLASMAYAVVLLLPPASWVLPAADSYAHYVTLPVGLWTLAVLIEVAARTLPVAELATPAEHEDGTDSRPGAEAYAGPPDAINADEQANGHGDRAHAASSPSNS